VIGFAGQGLGLLGINAVAAGEKVGSGEIDEGFARGVVGEGDGSIGEEGTTSAKSPSLSRNSVVVLSPMLPKLSCR